MTDASLYKPAVLPIIIQGAQVLLPSGKTALRDVAIADGKITAVGIGLEVANDTQTIDGGGLTLLPGVIDSGLHLRASSLEHSGEYTEDWLTQDLLTKDSFTQTLRTESCACVRGGVTSFLEMPNTPLNTTTQADLSAKLSAASRSSLVNYGFFVSATDPTQLDWLIADPDNHPTCGIVLNTSAINTNATNAADGSLSYSFSTEAAEIIESIFATDASLIAVHADIKTAMTLARKYERRLHISHVSTAEDIALLKKDKPSWISADITPHDLRLDVSTHEKLSALAQAQPPSESSLSQLLRMGECDRSFLWQALSQGTIDFIATGHTSPSLQSPMALNASSKLPSVETALPLMLTQVKEGRCTLAQVANWMSSAVAEAFCIPKKGLIEPGYDADLVLVDLVTYRPVRREELQTQCGWSPFEGWALTGWPVFTLVGGQVAYDRGEVNLNVCGQALRFDTN